MIASSLPVRTRLWVLIAVFSTALLMLCAQGFVALKNVAHSAGQMGDGKDIVADILPPPLYLIEAQLVCYEILQAPVDDRKKLADTLSRLKKEYQERNDYWKAKADTVDPAAISSLLGKQKAAADRYWSIVDGQFLPAALAAQEDAAARAFTELKTLYGEHRAGVDATVKLAGEWANDRLGNLDQTVRWASIVLFIVTGVALLVGLVIALFTIRSIVSPLARLQEVIRDTETHSDFTAAIAIHGKDELSRTSQSFNSLLASLRRAFATLQGTVGQVVEASRRLSDMTSQLASSAELQSSTAASMAATVEEITVSIGHVSDNAAQAALSAREAGDLSQHGGQVIRDAVAEITRTADTVHDIAAAIENLEQQSRQISSVVQIIKEVAEQTNLLALNAAIEAARAGEQGRGFAVVADEVRKLAEKTTKATEEIGTVIQSVQHTSQKAIGSVAAAVEQVSGGVNLATEAGAEIARIENGAKQVAALIEEISTSLIEQSAASHDIAQQVERVARAAEENKTLSDENAHAANDLVDTANRMHAAVVQFKT